MSFASGLLFVGMLLQSCGCLAVRGGTPDFRERQFRVKPWHFEDGFRFERVKAGREPHWVPLQARNRHKNRKTSWGVWFLHSRGVPAPTNLRRIKLRLNAPT